MQTINVFSKNRSSLGFTVLQKSIEQKPLIYETLTVKDMPESEKTHKTFAEVADEMPQADENLSEYVDKTISIESIELGTREITDKATEEKKQIDVANITLENGTVLFTSSQPVIEGLKKIKAELELGSVIDVTVMKGGKGTRQYLYLK